MDILSRGKICRQFMYSFDGQFVYPVEEEMVGEYCYFSPLQVSLYYIKIHENLVNIRVKIY